jgi:hypothetical protein
LNVTLTAVAVVEDDRVKMYINAEMEYRAADSIIISIAIRGRWLVPGIRDTVRIRMTISTVHSTVVATDSEYELSSTGRPMLSGITCPETSKPNIVIPRAESVYQLITPEESSPTYRPKIER